MMNTWNFSIATARIFILLNFLFARALSYDEKIENLDATPTINGVQRRLSFHIRNPFFRNENRSELTEENNFQIPTTLKRKNSIGDSYKPVIIRNENFFSVNPTEDIKHSRDTISSTDGSTDESTVSNDYRLSPVIEERPRHPRQASRSAQKCSEYHDEIAGLTPLLTLTGRGRVLSSRNLDESKCTTVRRLVVGGKDAEPQSLPHVVALGRENPENKKFVHHCGGSLISPTWVLTAAHCTHGVGGGVTLARLGIQHLSGNEGVTVAIERSIRHPSYTPPAKYADIALLELARPVVFGPSIKPACLHQYYYSIPRFASVCGWGATEFGGSESDTLQEAQLEFISNVECAIKHNSSVAVPDGVVPSMICAGAPNNNWEQDACQGDSGGPLQAPHPKYTCLHQIIGITSFGTGCAFVDSPGVYTRVAHYLDWIENIVWPLNS